MWKITTDDDEDDGDEFHGGKWFWLTYSSWVGIISNMNLPAVGVILSNCMRFSDFHKKLFSFKERTELFILNFIINNIVITNDSDNNN